MTLSMTGFGKAHCQCADELISVEVSSVNHRFLECSVRLPAAWSALDADIKRVVKNRLGRGKVNVIVSRRRGGVTRRAVQFDEGLAQQYIDAAKELAVMLRSGERLSLDVLAGLDGVFYLEEEAEDLDAIRGPVLDTLEQALEEVGGMRATEGEALAREIRGRVEELRTILAVVEARLPELNRLYEDRLRSRISELLEDTTLAEDRITVEVALMAEKADVTEEVVRLKTHLDHTLELLDSADPVGRQLDFLAQEIQREVNTLGVKTRDAEVTKDVLRMKAEHEKIREQVQNIQ